MMFFEELMRRIAQARERHWRRNVKEFRVTPSGVINCRRITPEGVTLNSLSAQAPHLQYTKDIKQSFLRSHCRGIVILLTFQTQQSG
jgi:hypothetical protein